MYRLAALVILPVADVFIQHATPFVWPRRERTGDDDACADAVFPVATIHIEVEIITVADGLRAAVEAADDIRLSQADDMAGEALIIQIGIDPCGEGDAFYAVSCPERRALSASGGRTAQSRRRLPLARTSILAAAKRRKGRHAILTITQSFRHDDSHANARPHLWPGKHRLRGAGPLIRCRQ